ncbi:cobalamin biosynthesis protein CobD [Corynebacterium diphtheriae]|nr:cobalamin biosynthesis protein CobD [Corynebacterium diphtheriae]CAB0520297.1 cobalamin biosynthesis protein CobD [Corynebacterium diphtheriae]CAB0907378.1 cobalamin biosynthesis protein CobD [Corynebacterium diphtheriae]CAB0958933.1 cobalamin biosynthesis protein CobD [Corynebacterium diphtheriae]
MLAGLVSGVVLDRIVGDPGGSLHPVAVFGRWATWVEKKIYAPSKLRGAIYVAVTVAPPTAAAVMIGKKYPNAALAASLVAAIGGSTLENTGVRMARALERDDIEAARDLVPWLCSRDPEYLDESGIVRATVESLAENTSDSTIAPVVWAALGAGGVVAHRCVNTLDAMVGYKNDRYSEFGWAAAKLDDAMAWVPARLTAVAHVGAAAMRGRERAALRAWRVDAPHHPSPNAGPVEATAAAALGVTLGGETRYSYGIEKRPPLGVGPSPSVATIHQAVRLSRGVQAAATVAIAGLMLWRRY